MTRLIALASLTIVGFVAGCEAGTGPPPPDPLPGNEVVLGDDRGGIPPVRNPLPDPPPPPPPRPEGGLLPLSRATIGRELAPDAGCALDDTARGPLLVAVAGDAIVNNGGHIVHLKPDAGDLETLTRGGRFVGRGLVVEIDREYQVERVDEVTTWQATLRMIRGRLGFTSFHHRWSCGA